MGFNLRLQSPNNMVLRGVLPPFLLRRLLARQHQQQIYASHQQLHPKIQQKRNHRLKHVGDEDIYRIYRRLEVEGNSIENEEHHSVEHKKLLGVSDRQERILRDGRLRFHDRRKLESLDHRNQYEPQHGPLHPRHKKISENGTTRYGQPNHLHPQKEIKKCRIVHLYLSRLGGPT